MDRKLIVILIELVKSYQKQANEQALATVKWQAKLAAIEGDLLTLVEADVTATLAKPKKDGADDSW